LVVMIVCFAHGHTTQVTSGSLVDLVKKVIPGAIKKEIEKVTNGIFPLQVL